MTITNYFTTATVLLLMLAACGAPSEEDPGDDEQPAQDHHNDDRAVEGSAPTIEVATHTECEVFQPCLIEVAIDGDPEPIVTLETGLVAGMSFDADAGVIEGRPEPGAVGDVELVVRADNGVEPYAQVSFELSVVAPTPPQELVWYRTGSDDDAGVEPAGPALVLMGGGPDVDEAFQWWNAYINGGDVVVLRTSGSDGYNDYLYHQIGAVNSVETLVVDRRSLADDPYVAYRLQRAEAIFMAGGDQATYLESW